MKELRFTEEGPVFVEELKISANTKFEMPTEEEILNKFKDTIIFALDKRAKHCMKDLSDNTDRIISTNSSTIEYLREDGTYNAFNYPSYQAMLDAIELTNKNKFKEFTAAMWEQLVKSLYWVKPINKDGVTFANLLTVVIDKLNLAMMELANK